MNKIVLFFQEVVGEMKKVVWPTQEEVLEYTKVVVISTILLSIVFGLVDGALVYGIESMVQFFASLKAGV
jgi:preprotein translocase subunit SecE